MMVQAFVFEFDDEARPFGALVAHVHWLSLPM
jgi:hypothetical protein